MIFLPSWADLHAPKSTVHLFFSLMNLATRLMPLLMLERGLGQAMDLHALDVLDADHLGPYQKKWRTVQNELMDHLKRNKEH